MRAWARRVKRLNISRMAVTAAIAGIGFVTTRRMAYRLTQTRLLDHIAMPALITPHAPAASLLIVGDSTALGTGASSPQASLAGRFANSYPDLRIANCGRRGARFATLGDEIARHGRHDVIMILAGANDVIRHTGMARLKADIDDAITQASKQALHVVVVPAPNLGNAPIFPAPLSWWLTLRSRRLHAACRRSVQARGATYVNLFRRWRDDPFAHDPALIASDDLHPSDAGYAFWFGELERQAPLSRFLALPPSG
jgi:lysophospholipase L1-like esterase